MSATAQVDEQALARRVVAGEALDAPGEALQVLARALLRTMGERDGFKAVCEQVNQRGKRWAR